MILAWDMGSSVVVADLSGVRGAGLAKGSAETDPANRAAGDISRRGRKTGACVALGAGVAASVTVRVPRPA